MNDITPPKDVSSQDILVAAYNLLGDGQGDEWGDNPEYARAIMELVRDSIGSIVDDDGSTEACYVAIRKAGQQARHRRVNVRCEAVMSALENVRDSESGTWNTIEYALTEAEGYVRDGMSKCTC